MFILYVANELFSFSFIRMLSVKWSGNENLRLSKKKLSNGLNGREREWWMD